MKLGVLARGYKSMAGVRGATGVGFHDLRHFHASVLVALNIPTQIVQARIGRESIHTHPYKG
jgi:integrase